MATQPIRKMTAPRILARKNGVKIVSITAYDAVSGELADAAGVDLILVGDSVGNVVLGMPSTLPVSLQDMIHHTAAVSKVVRQALLVADLPFGSYQSSIAQSVDSAVALVKAGAEAVKLEGAYSEQIAAITKAGIPVMGHVGLTPQSLNRFGGFKIQGKGEDSKKVFDSAKEVADAGAFAMVLEGIPSALAKEITANVPCPTVGIGAGPDCDGQIQVFHDILGLSPMKLKHAKVYCEGSEIFRAAICQYAGEVRDVEFPGSEHSV